MTRAGTDLEWETSRDEVVKRSIYELNKLDALARDMERKWGVGRLPLLVSDDLSDRFFSQHRKTSQALRSGDPYASLEHLARMRRAWIRLDAEAERLGANKISSAFLEAVLSDGSVLKIVRDMDEAAAVRETDDERQVQIFTASEIARLVELLPTVLEVKRHFPGATVRPTRFETPPHFWEHGDEIPF